MNRRQVEAAMMKEKFPHLADDWYLSQPKPVLWGLIGDVRGKKILEIGACHGVPSLLAAKAGAKVVATDIFGCAMHHSLTRVVCDKESLPFHSDHFDIVMCKNVLHHGNLEPTLNEVHRVLKPGGQLVCFEEPCIPDNIDEKAYMTQWCKQELGLGIDERRPCMGKYVSALVAFRMVTFFSSKGGWPIPTVSRHEGIGIQAFK